MNNRNANGRQRDGQVDGEAAADGSEETKTTSGGEKTEGEVWRGEVVLRRGGLLAVIVFVGLVCMCCLCLRRQKDSALTKRRDNMANNKKGRRGSNASQLQDLEDIYPNITEEVKPLTPNTQA